jgi:hypothetical protein
MFGSIPSSEGRNSTISSFHSKYNVPVPTKSDKKTEGSSISGEDSDEEDVTYRLNFNDDSQLNNNELGYSNIKKIRNQDVLDTLSTISKVRL